MNLYNSWSKLVHTTTTQSTHPQSARLFIIAIHLWVLIDALLLWPAGEQFWGPEAYLQPLEHGGLSSFEYALNILSWPGYASYFHFIIGGQVISTLIVLFKPRAWWASLSVWLTTSILAYRAPDILDGGNNLIQLMLLYIVLIQLAPSPSTPAPLAALRHALANAAFLLARLQLATVYLCAGLAKIHGELWSKGVALYYTLNVTEYSHPLLADLLSRFPSLSVLGSYFTLMFQISFPFLIWSRPLRPWWLFGGGLLHLGIAFGMGLINFGFAMCACYTVFYHDQQARQILQRGATLYRRCHHSTKEILCFIQSRWAWR